VTRPAGGIRLREDDTKRTFGFVDHSLPSKAEKRKKKGGGNLVLGTAITECVSSGRKKGELTVSGIRCPSCTVNGLMVEVWKREAKK